MRIIAIIGIIIGTLLVAYACHRAVCRRPTVTVYSI